MKKLTVVLMTILFYQSVCKSATFCVTTSVELQTALDDANVNNQHNVIRIAEGFYNTPGSQFSYNQSGTNAGWDLEISGGWTDFFLNPCGQQLSGDPFLTVLVGEMSNRILRINAKGLADITISNLLFISGKVGSTSNGGGLFIFSSSLDSTGDLILERNVFTNNEADSGSAISISGFDTMRISNNLFTANHAVLGTTVNLHQNDANGIYFINNTVISNSYDDNPNLGAGVRTLVTGTSSVAIYNNLLWDNDNHDLQLSGSGLSYLSNNDIGRWVGNTPTLDSNNLSTAPDLIPGILSYTPAATSPLIDAGKKPPTITQIPTPFSQNWSLGLVDLLGNIRSHGATVDIGAFEFTPEVPIFINGFE